jgi:hypothetical protein
MTEQFSTAGRIGKMGARSFGESERNSLGKFLETFLGEFGLKKGVCSALFRKPE